MQESTERQGNRLRLETSPYLLQHAHNPVDWYPWTDEVFDAAKQADKPIFLSIGYSACHWCHVMERESFEDEEMSSLLNQTFYCVKVDREERPDVDKIYMTACQVMTGRGGWPLTVFLTPDKRPFFAGTYFPKHGMYGRPGLLEIARRTKELWEKDRGELDSIADKLLANMRDMDSSFDQILGVHPSADPASLLTQGARSLKARFDSEHGGFSSAPKFPTPHQLLFLLRCWRRTGDTEALEQVETTLRAMRLGGIWDHLGFGFHRYATDPNWLVPHFEKMLYDQALLVLAYLEAYQVTHNALYRDTAVQTLTYVLRDLQGPDGAFQTAEDADSEGVEGKFYVWTADELGAALDPADAEVAMRVYRCTPEGNYHDEATRRPTGSNILHHDPALMHRTDPLSSDALGCTTEQLDAIRTRLFEVRSARARPGKDTKCLVDWNGLAIAAFARAARTLGSEAPPEFLGAAVRAAEWILQHADAPGPDGTRRLFHCRSAGGRALPAHLDDYAFTAWGLLELHQTTLDARYLEEALHITQYQIAHFWDSDAGAFFFTGNECAETLPLRHKSFEDGAIPAGNSVSLHNLLRLARLTGASELETDTAHRLVEHQSTQLSLAPSAFTFLLQGIDYALGPATEVILVGCPSDPRTDELLRAATEGYAPRTVLLLKNPADPARVLRLAPYTADLEQCEGRPTAYVCCNRVCSRPVCNPDTLRKMLGHTSAETGKTKKTDTPNADTDTDTSASTVTTT